MSRGAERFRVIGQGQSIQFNFGGRPGVVRLAWNATDWQRYLQTLTPSSSEPDERHGTDGWVPLEVEVNTSGAPITIQLPVDP